MLKPSDKKRLQKAQDKAREKAGVPLAAISPLKVIQNRLEEKLKKEKEEKERWAKEHPEEVRAMEEKRKRQEEAQKERAQRERGKYERWRDKPSVRIAEVSRVSNFRLPPRFESISLDEYLPWSHMPAGNRDKRINVIRSWIAQIVDSPGSGDLCILGSVGQGKTHLAAAALIEWAAEVSYRNRDDEQMQKGLVPDGMFTRMNDLTRDYREIWREDRNESNVMGTYFHTGLLVMDDMHDDRSPASIDAVAEVLEKRYDTMLPTVVTANLQPEEIAETFGARVADRILSGTVLILSGKSYRAEKR